MSKKSNVKRGADSLQHIVGLLVKAATAQEELAATYREMGWDLEAQTCDDEARNFRQRSETFAAESKQSNGGDERLERRTT
jgi:predicted dithiol-disulfide oxidoreductase (DUF899 family)